MSVSVYFCPFYVATLYSSELNLVERVWLYLRERFLSMRVFNDYLVIVEACCDAWSRLIAEARPHPLPVQPELDQKVTS